MEGQSGGAPLRIAMLGQKGFPAVWGGVEFHVAELAGGLARRGHDVTVFVRSWYQREGAQRGLSVPPGVRVRFVPCLPTKHLDALTHTCLSTLVARRGFDILHYHAIGPGSMIALARVLAPRSLKVLTVHALDWGRAKWASWAKRLLRLGEAAAVRTADGIIAVSSELRRYLGAQYGVEAAVIPNGVHPARLLSPGAFLRSLGLSPRRYLLCVGRLVPEKGVHLAIEAFGRIESDWKLVIAGPAQEAGYRQRLEEIAGSDRRILLPGLVYGDDLAELYSNAGALLVPSLLEGLPLTVLEGLSYGLPVVASDLPAIREAVRPFSAEGVYLFQPGDVDSLAARLGGALAASGRGLRGPREGAGGLCTWAEVVGRTEGFYAGLRTG